MESPKQLSEPVENVLLETRKILSSALGLTVALGDKIHGPRPGAEGTCADRPVCLRSIASDLRDLATSIQNELQDHHGALGFDSNHPPMGGTQARAALR
jgi:hypothetical protein